jgi:hypothetical protein
MKPQPTVHTRALSATTNTVHPGTPTESLTTRVRSAPIDQVVLAVVALVGSAGVLLSTARFGVGLTPDSVVYITGARSLADGRGYTHLDGGAIGSWPPGYSFILSLGERLGIDAMSAARGLSVLGLLATIGVTFLLLRRHIRSPGIRAASLAVVGCSAVLLEIYSKALSEHLFVPVVLTFVIACEELLARPGDTRLFVALVLLSWASFYLRYAGIVVIPIGALILLGAGWRSEPSRALLRAAGFTVLAASLPIVWMVRNDRAGVDPMGPRAEASATLAGNVRRVANESSQWVATQLAPPALRAVVFGIFLLVVAIAALIVLRGSRTSVLRGSRTSVLRGSGTSAGDLRPLIPMLLFVGVYVGYLVASASIVAFGAINTRFMVPVFVPVIVLSAWLFERARAEVTSPGLRAAVTWIALAWVIVNVGWFGGRAIGYAQHGAGGYATERWHSSAIMKDVERLDFSIPTYTNDPRAVATFVDQPATVSPARTFFNSDSKTEDLPRFVRRVGCTGHVQLVWFLPNVAKYLYQRSELERHVKLTPVVERDDGVIYDVSALGARPADCSP